MMKKKILTEFNRLFKILLMAKKEHKTFHIEMELSEAKSQQIGVISDHFGLTRSAFLPGFIMSLVRYADAVTNDGKKVHDDKKN